MTRRWLVLWAPVLLALGACNGHVMSPRADAKLFGPAAPGTELGRAGEGHGRPSPPFTVQGEPLAPHRAKSGAELALEDISPTLAKVSAIRELRVLRPVEGKVLDRDAVIARVMAKVERDYPPGVLRAQGELLAALELVPADYDYEAGMYGLLKSNVAGFYDPDDKAMVLLDDLDAANIKDTLAHELVHALQDQHYELEPLLRYRPHDSDRVAAVQVLSEGDAMSGMFEVTQGSAFDMPESWMRFMLLSSTAFSDGGSDVPRVLHLSLIAPYVDGFALVQELRRRGNWAAVDEVWRHLPVDTEQVLHLDKYLAHEPPIELGVPPLEPLGRGWTVLDHDVLGEQGLRISLEKWSSRDAAATAAAGWGGDRYVVAVRPLGPPPTAAAAGPASSPTVAAPSVASATSTAVPKLPTGPSELAAAWVVRFDTPADARELADLLRGALGAGCRERPLLGALTWLTAGSTVVIAAGPYQRDAKGARQPAPPSCPLTKAWAKSMLTAASRPAPAAPAAPAAPPRR